VIDFFLHHGRQLSGELSNLMRIGQLRVILLIPLLAFLASCVSLSPQAISKKFQRPSGCEEFLDALDAKVMDAGVLSASSFPIPGFPYLRTNRFLSSLKERLKDEEGKEQWVQLMRELDLEARAKEISNLPDEMVLPIHSMEEVLSSRERLLGQVKACSETLVSHDMNRPDVFETLKTLVDVPDEYSFFLRAVGLYPLTMIPVAAMTDVSRRIIRSWYETSLENLPVDGRLKSFAPAATVFLDEKEVHAMIDASKKNPLDIPLPEGDIRGRLVRSFAPIFIQDVAGSYDEPGRVIWKGRRAEVDSTRPTVYYYFSHAFLKGEPILQINYGIWFSERAGERPPRIEKGHLDGLTVRVSLDTQGLPFMVDVINNCGCYHLFAPDQERVDRIVSQPLEFDAFVPQWLPTIPSGTRLGIRLSSGWHQVQRLLAVQETSDSTPYELIPYDVIESLSQEDGRRESLFDMQGIAKGSERTERFILFSMGVPSIGSMRQRGHHAIELIGRVHFDDPYLFERNFVFK